MRIPSAFSHLFELFIPVRLGFFSAHWGVVGPDSSYLLVCSSRILEYHKETRQEKLCTRLFHKTSQCAILRMDAVVHFDEIFCC